MGNVESIDLSLENVWKSWFFFKKGKRKTAELDYFQYFLEKNNYDLWRDLDGGTFQHGRYQKFIVRDNKRREISVAGIRDRVVHRLLYGYLVEIFDKTFIADVWSCRKNKGLVGAIEKTQEFLEKHPRSFVWRSDMRKFFDSVDHGCLKNIISKKILDIRAMNLIEKVIDSYWHDAENEPGSRHGIPIGNLTSQIFANIYLNELDQFVKSEIRTRVYLRYGDDFIIIADNAEKLIQIRNEVLEFATEKLKLGINQKNDIIIRVRYGLKFLGMEIFPKGRRLKKRNWKRAEKRLSIENVASYGGLIGKHSKKKLKNQFNWIIMENIIH